MTSTDNERVILEIEDILKTSLSGFAMSDLYWVENAYKLTHGKPLNYRSFGVNNIQELFYELGKQKRVALLRYPLSKQICVMPLRLAEVKQKCYLTFIVKELFHMYGGDIPFTSFLNLYKEECKSEFGLTKKQFFHLLKDTVRFGKNESGEKVMKEVNNDSSRHPAVTKEIEEILEESPLGIEIFYLLCKIEERHGKYTLDGKSLDYMSFGVGNIHYLLFELFKQEKVIFLKKPETKEVCVMSVSVAEFNQKRSLKAIVKNLLDKYGGEIAFSSFEDFYKDTRKVEWNSHQFGLTDLDQLCRVLKGTVMVEVNESGDKVMKPVNKDSSGQAAVTREIEEVLERCSPWGIAMSDLSCIEGSYQLMHGKSLDYECFGVENIKDLFFELGKQDKVLFLNRTECEDEYVMSKRLAESQHKGNLKLMVEELLKINGGEINFFSFGDCYLDKYKVEWNPNDYGFYSLGRLCDVLKDIVMVKVDPSGDRVIKAVNKDSSGQEAYISRKRKVNE